MSANDKYKQAYLEYLSAYSVTRSNGQLTELSDDKKDPYMLVARAIAANESANDKPPMKEEDVKKILDQLVNP